MVVVVAMLCTADNTVTAFTLGHSLGVKQKSHGLNWANRQNQKTHRHSS